MKRKHTALRTCVGCQRIRNQNELVRFVRSLRGPVEEDYFKNKLGRGAYICADSKERCLVLAIKRHAFDRALPRDSKV